MVYSIEIVVRGAVGGGSHCHIDAINSNVVVRPREHIHDGCARVCAHGYFPMCVVYLCASVCVGQTLIISMNFRIIVKVVCVSAFASHRAVDGEH